SRNTLELVINDGMGEQTLATDLVMTAGEWYTISLSMAGDTAALTVQELGGQTHTASGTITADPVDAVSADGRYYIGRGAEESTCLAGSMDYFRVYHKDAAEAEYYYTETETIISTSSGIYGDLNQDEKVNAFDLAILKRKVLMGEYNAFADCNNDYAINVADVVSLQKYLLGYGSEYIGGEIMAD
ncbi:MAG: dockerin type I repeat-containing protein, partial [Oscillospiraceae bacterium]|nr:dockerin type I repeat-containing protein [Oscillospiraceae bacterium]